MITVYSVLWGNKYKDYYAHALQKQVEANLTVPHRFVCITDKWLEDIETIRPVQTWRGWWQKLQLFHFATGPSLYFDLDVVITGNLDYLAPFTGSELAAPANWAQSGHGGIQSSVLAWDGSYKEPYERLRVPATYIEVEQRLHGDQCYLTELRGDNFDRLPGIYSYKYHCRGDGLPADCKVAVFHGKPDPHEVAANEDWINENLYQWPDRQP